MSRGTFFRFAAPSMIVMTLLMVIPLLMAIWLGMNFFTYNNINSPQFIGLRNYIDVLTDPKFWQSFRFTAIYALIVVPATIFTGFTIALLLDQVSGLARGVYLSIFLLPFIIVPIVGNIAEHFSGITLAAKNKMDIALGIAAGSSTQVAVLVAPLLILLSLVLGPGAGFNLRQAMNLVFLPIEIVAVVAAAFGYGVMNLLMVATPLAMSFCGHPFKEGVFVLEWHVFGMFAPSFFTGSLIKRFGALPIIVFGCLLNFATIAIDLSGTTVAHFWFGLFVLGVGWNFMYIGGTTLLTETYRPSERTRVQGFNDTVVFTTMAISSSSAGVLVNAEGWEIVNYTAAPFIAIALVAAVAL